LLLIPELAAGVGVGAEAMFFLSFPLSFGLKAFVI
jgi:hypothetical protein